MGGRRVEAQVSSARVTPPLDVLPAVGCCLKPITATAASAAAAGVRKRKPRFAGSTPCRQFRAHAGAVTHAAGAAPGMLRLKVLHAVLLHWR